MVKVDFTHLRSFAQCPIWWRNFVVSTTADFKGTYQNRNLLLSEAIAKYHGEIVDGEGEEDVSHLEFETQDDLNAFKIYWTLHGE
jgi:hypothetical protein